MITAQGNCNKKKTSTNAFQVVKSKWFAQICFIYDDDDVNLLSQCSIFRWVPNYCFLKYRLQETDPHDIVWKKRSNIIYGSLLWKKLDCFCARWMHRLIEILHAEAKPAFLKCKQWAKKHIPWAYKSHRSATCVLRARKYLPSPWKYLPSPYTHHNQFVAN